MCQSIVGWRHFYPIFQHTMYLHSTRTPHSIGKRGVTGKVNHEFFAFLDVNFRNRVQRVTFANKSRRLEWRGRMPTACNKIASICFSPAYMAFIKTNKPPYKLFKMKAPTLPTPKKEHETLLLRIECTHTHDLPTAISQVLVICIVYDYLGARFNICSFIYSKKFENSEGISA